MKKYGICFLFCIVCMAAVFWIYPKREPEVAALEAVPSSQADEEGFFLVLGKNEELVIYHADQSTVYKKLSHEHIALDEEQLEQLAAGIQLADAEQLYRYLESITS